MLLAGPVGAFFYLLYKIVKWLLKKLLLKPILFLYLRWLKFQRNIIAGKLLGNVKYLHWIKLYGYQTIAILIVLLTTVNNLTAHNLVRDDFDTPSRLAQVISNPEASDYSTFSTEQAAPLHSTGVTNYLQDLGALEPPANTSPSGSDEIEGFLSITQGDNTLEAPSIGDIESLPTARTRTIVYTVQSGDTISEIAQKFGISTNTIVWANNLSLRATLKPGQKLDILPTSGTTHKVASGETLAAIAKKYQTDKDKIIAFNKLANEKDIRAGEILVIPGGVKPATVVATPYRAPSATNVFKNIVGGTASNDSGTKLLWPTVSHRISQYFSWRHTGLDIPDKKGNPIYAAENGRVITAGWNRGGYGYYIIIDHGNGMQTVYGHCSALLVTAGQSVSRGQQIGEIGSTGRSTGPHLHLEVRLSGRRTNPLNYIR